MRYQINVQRAAEGGAVGERSEASQPVAKFTLKPDAIRMARLVTKRKGVTNVVLIDKRVGEPVAF